MMALTSLHIFLLQATISIQHMGILIDVLVPLCGILVMVVQVSSVVTMTVGSRGVSIRMMPMSIMMGVMHRNWMHGSGVMSMQVGCSNGASRNTTVVVNRLVVHMTVHIVIMIDWSRIVRGHLSPTG